jgi:predicted nucleic acid-binding protein
VIADTTFLIHLVGERRRDVVGPARAFLGRHRASRLRITIISLAEIAVSFRSSDGAWEYFREWGVYRLHDGIAKAAADVDRDLARLGQRLGENDDWIAGFARYYREPVISLDGAFDRVPRLRRVGY